VKNALEDLRNYTILAEIALEDDNVKGNGDDSKLDGYVEEPSGEFAKHKIIL